MLQMYQGVLIFYDGVVVLIFEFYVLIGVLIKESYVFMRGLMVQVLGNEYKKRDCVSSNK